METQNKIAIISIAISIVIMVGSQNVKALTESQKSIILAFTNECTRELGLPADHILTKAESMMGCKIALKHLFDKEGGAEAYIQTYQFGG